MKCEDIKIEHPLYRHAIDRCEDVFIAVFKFMKYHPVPDEVLEIATHIRAFRDSLTDAEKKLLREWNGGLVWYEPCARQDYLTPELKACMTEPGEAGPALVREMVEAVEAFAGKNSIISTWDNSSNDGHGYSIAFKANPAPTNQKDQGDE